MAVVHIQPSSLCASAPDGAAPQCSEGKYRGTPVEALGRVGGLQRVRLLLAVRLCLVKAGGKGTWLKGRGKPVAILLQRIVDYYFVW